MLPKKYYSVGAHITSRFIVTIELSWIKNQPKLLATSFQFPRNRKFYGAIGSTEMLCKQIETNDLLSDQEVELLLQNCQEEYFTAIEEPLVFDFVRLDNNQILIYATRQKNILEQQNFFKNLKWSLASIEPDSYALLRAIRLKNIEKQEAAFLYRDEDHIRIFIFNDQWISNEYHYKTPKNSLLISPEDFQMIKTRYLHETQIIYMLNHSAVNSYADKIIKIDPFDSFEQNFSSEEKNKYLIALGLALRGGTC